MGKKYGLPPSGEIHIQESYTNFSGNAEREPDWDLFEKSLKEKFKNLDGAGIVELYAMKNGGTVEKKAREIMERTLDIPVVCSHELFSELNSLQRGSSTLLNASLFPVIKEFLEAIKKAMMKRGLNASLVIVRSDGSLMSEEFAALRPVETLLCGPASSISGGLRLSAEKDCVIVDMGGTTTDIALVKNGFPVEATGGVSIGKWRTFVHGFFIRTLGLGGDSAVHYRDSILYLEEYRVVPLCIAAAAHPEIVNNLKSLLEKGIKHSFFLHEHFILIKDINESERYSEREKKFCAILAKGPLIMKDAAQALNTDIYNLNVSGLIKDGVIQLCGFTPTDAMLIKNDFYRSAVSGSANFSEDSGSSREASLLGARFIALNLGTTVEKLCDRVYEEVRQKLYVNVVKVLLENNDKYYSEHGIDKEAERFILNNYRHAAAGNPDRQITLNFKTDFSLVGIGAPIHVFLPELARLLGARSVIPEYFNVANALGAVASQVRASYTVEVHPEFSPRGITGYKVYGPGTVKTFMTLKEAEACAAEEAAEGAEKEARKRGAHGKLELNREIRRNEGTAKNNTFYMGSTVIAHASGELA